MAIHPIMLILLSFPIACFFLALATDIAYSVTADTLWADASAWLLAVGIITAAVAAVAGLIDLLVRRRVRARRPVLPLAVGSVCVLILAFFNNLVHSRDAWTSVVPTGLALSAGTVVVLLITAWSGSRDVPARQAGVDYTGAPR